MSTILTVAVCTWNRAESLERALNSISYAIAALREPVQLIVVNNNCTDDTDDVVQRVSEQVPIDLVHELRPGLANARNAATAASYGEYIVWTDDDVVVAPAWLVSYSKAFERHPSAIFFGGPIRPKFEGLPPQWLRRSWSAVGSSFAQRDLGCGEFRIQSARDLPYGANFAIRGEDQRSLRYDPLFGRQPTDYWRGGDEILVLARLLELGGEAWWVPDAEVTHVIDASRQTLSYQLRYGFGIGKTDALRAPPRPGLRVLGRPAYLWWACAKSITRAIVMRVASDPEKWLPALRAAASSAGKLYGHRVS